MSKYLEYLQSNKWRRKRNQCKANHGTKCLVCWKRFKDIHHKTYKDLENENAEHHLIPLCRQCHYKVHNYCKKNNVNIYQGTEQYIKKFSIRPVEGKRKWKDLTPIEKRNLLR